MSWYPQRDALQKKVAELERQIEKHWSTKKDAFVKMNDGLISREEYENISAENRSEIQRLRLESELLEYAAVSGQQPETARPDKLAGATSAGGVDQRDGRYADSSRPGI